MVVLKIECRSILMSKNRFGCSGLEYRGSALQIILNNLKILWKLIKKFITESKLGK